ncbi:PLP-dependent aminotransferase family protein [Dactylosporangium vinaceum]|uniref:PLP-dependent aminotransferase family protein n=1 Tax=Dactylosporangium vinaceum TaxID=53362 RepID=A0ABV5MRQ7_9ACTN|nr:PLP-dependent aminotransferase family protein [Dactylosporangium vinaceum]UAC00386.1 PLP-dependent aminotransferase family protein [Dactylosporangium vinaceum]
MSYQQVAAELAASIRSGQVPPGTRLPTHRDLARERGIAVGTATRVYAELARLGLTVGEPGRGTYVREPAGYDGPEPSRALPVPRVADLSFNQPLAAQQAGELRRALRGLAAAGDIETLLHQEPPGGRRGDRAAVARYLLGRGVDTAPANVLLTGGTQAALDTVLGAVTRPGDVLAVDALTYPGIRLLAAAHGLRLAPIPVTAAGPDLGALPRRTPVRAVYAIPTVHNPLGWVLGRRERARIVEFARARDCLIVEDGTYAFLEPSAPPPLQALAPERTCYVAGLSKNVAAGLRFGFAVLPDAHTAAAIRRLRTTTWGSPPLVTALATGWLSDGTVTRLEQTRRADAAARQRIARTALHGLDTIAHPGAYTVWLHLQPHQRMDHAAALLAGEGILVSTADAFATGPYRPHALRLALANPPLDELGAILHRLRAALDTIAP